MSHIMRKLDLSYANNKGADQPVHPHSLISTFVVRCLDCIIPLLAKSKISGPQLVSEAEQADLSLTWSQTPKTGFLMTWLIYCMSEQRRLRWDGVDVQARLSLHCSLVWLLLVLWRCSIENRSFTSNRSMIGCEIGKSIIIGKNS